MRKAIGYFVGVLTAVFFLLSLLGSRDNYVVEQVIWAANLQLVNLGKNPESTPRPAFEKVERRLAQVVKDFPQSEATPTAYLLLGRTHLLQKDYAGARGKFEEIVKLYPKRSEACAQALSAIANTYEIEGNWPEALKAYQGLKNNYPLTDLGLTVPLYLATYYAANAHDVNANDSFDDAVGYYEHVFSQHADSEIGLKALQLLSNCYIAQKKWNDAIKVLGRVLFAFPKPDTAMAVVKTINTIAAGQLKDVNQAIAVYQSFIDQNPKSPLNKGLHQVIKELSSLKGQSVQADKAL